MSALNNLLYPFTSPAVLLADALILEGQATNNQNNVVAIEAGYIPSTQAELLIQDTLIAEGTAEYVALDGRVNNVGNLYNLNINEQVNITTASPYLIYNTQITPLAVGVYVCKLSLALSAVDVGENVYQTTCGYCFASQVDNPQNNIFSTASQYYNSSPDATGITKYYFTFGFEITQFILDNGGLQIYLLPLVSGGVLYNSNGVVNGIQFFKVK
jgi:hypothetical protein